MYVTLAGFLFGGLKSLHICAIEWAGFVVALLVRVFGPV